MSEKKKRTHKFLNKHPFIGAILQTAVFIALFVITTSLSSYILKNFISDANVYGGISILIAFILWSLVFLWWFRGETSGLIFGGDIKGGAFVAGLFVAFWVLVVCFIYLRKDSVMKKITAVWDKKWSGVVD
jgi:hypothetical protein